MWIKIKKGTYNIDGFNMHKPRNQDVYEMWILKTNGKTECIATSTEREKIVTISEMLNYAAENKISFVDLEEY